ncbi:MAG: methyltransferase domain-containing protein, partial [Armatimonadota bacterium]
MIWRDRLPKAPLDPQRVQRETGIQSVADWIALFNSFPAELPEPFAIIDVLEGPVSETCCEALRALKRNPRYVRSADVNMTSNRLCNVNAVLYDIAERMNPGTALDLGCGAGRDSVWLAANGWEVTAVDRIQTNLDQLKKLRAAYAPSDPIHWVQANLNETKPENQYDLVLLHYCWDPNYFRLAKQ